MVGKVSSIGNPPLLTALGNLAACSLLIVLLLSCSFNYGNEESDKSQPDIVMESVEYVRMRDADPQARFMAERAERYEERRIMELLNFSFEQFGNQGEDVNASGRAGSGTVEIDSGDIRMDNSVRIEVESEDIAIETLWIEWKDSDRVLFGGDEEEVVIQQQNGTTFIGTGFHADAGRRTWKFSGNVEGTFIHEDDEEEIGAVTSAENKTETPTGDAPSGDGPSDEPAGTPSGAESPAGGEEV
jgi:LPS export ABC transporter protein LptC